MINILLRWPNGPYSDPNDHYRDYLEQHIGTQGKDWEWHAYPPSNFTKIIILIFDDSKQESAFIMQMMWS